MAVAEEDKYGEKAAFLTPLAEEFPYKSSIDIFYSKWIEN